MPRRRTRSACLKAFLRTRNTSRQSHPMEEPTLALLGGCDLDDTAVVPVGWTEVAAFLNFLVDPIQNLAFPPTGRAAVAEAIAGVPASAVGLPRHQGVFADILQGQFS